MRILDALERRLGWFAVPNLTYWLIAGQVVAFVAIFANPANSWYFGFHGSMLTTRYWWTVLTMLFRPLDMQPIWAVLTWYLYYMYGSALEREWGSFRYTLYFALAYAASIASALLFPQNVASNGYIFLSVFLAFAYLFPDFKLLLFFVIPVKVKWLALLSWVGMCTLFVFGAPATKTLVALSLANFFLFFGADLWGRVRTGYRGARRAAGAVAERKTSYMKCAMCGATEKDSKTFYWCHTCKPDRQYCEDCIKTHTHRVEA